jgi:arylformamidase
MMTTKKDDWLNREYNARAMTSGFEVEAIYRDRSLRVFAGINRIADIVYDEKSGSKLDIYPAQVAHSPLFVWIHGGFWRASSKDVNAFVVPGLVANGITVATIDYSLAPKVTLDEIVREVRASIAWLHRHAPRYGAETRVIHVGGHSAGGHLVGMLLAHGWHDQFGVPHDVIGTAMPISGLFDLAPLRQTFVNDFLFLDKAAALRNSPLACLPEHSTAKLVASYGGDESSEFRRQTRDYVAAWQRNKLSGTEVSMPSFHHFDIILELESPGNPLFDALYSSISA